MPDEIEESNNSDGLDPAELDLTDDDILDAMSEIEGYLDITTADFRTIYQLAQRRALTRLYQGLSAARLMRTDVRPLRPDTPLDVAAEQMISQGRKGLPVVDDEQRVIGMLTETDFLRRLRADSFLTLMLKLLRDAAEFSQRCHETPVNAAMTTPAVTVLESAGYREILQAFRAQPGRSVPVVGSDGRLRGLLTRKDFVRAHQLGMNS